jgi:leucyl/phenylalanyl-tRNA--protein transferase
MPVEPEPTPWVLPDLDRLPAELEDEDLVGLGADLAPGTLLAAYRSALFPMHVSLDDEAGRPQQVLGWWSPAQRGVLPLDALAVSRSLRQSVRRMRTTVDQRFADVVEGCADRGAEGRWINDEIRAAYLRLHEMGWAHSIETWQDDRLVGGLYGVAIGGLFAGESMYYRLPDASKVALVRLVEVLRDEGRPRLLDVQWVTSHLASLGAQAVPRQEYRRLLRGALAEPLPRLWRDAGEPSLPDRD